MVHRDIPSADPPAPTPAGPPVDQATPGDSIPAGRILARGLRIIGRLGSTPEGALYQAEYPNGVEVALLVLRSEAGGGGRSGREQFARATQIQHPNVAAVYEVAEMEDGSVYVVLEHLVGEPLSKLLAEGHSFALGDAVDLVLQAAAGLRAAYREGFVHGNFSPQNILVTRELYGRPQVKLTGFTLDSPLRQGDGKASIPGEASAGYASPERLVGHPPDERSEVFSLGAVLYHLLTGKPPYLTRVGSSVPKVARAVLGTALAPTPDRRFQTISELDEALKHLAAVAAKPKMARSDRVALIGVVASLALVTGGIWLLPGSNWRATSGPQAVLPTTREAPAVPEPPPLPPRPTAAERFAGMKQTIQEMVWKPGADSPPAPERKSRNPDDLPSADQAVAAPSGSPRVRSADAPTPAAVEKRATRRADESPPTPEPLGYVAEPEPTSVPTPPPAGRPAPAARPPRAAPPTRTTADPRPRAELERNPALRLSIADVVRVGIAEDVAEIRPGLLMVSLTPAAMRVPSVTYNLERLYLGYSAATQFRRDVALELRHGPDLYGWFTREGLTQAPTK